MSNITTAPADTGWRAEPATGADIIAESHGHLAVAVAQLADAREHLTELNRHLNKIAELVNAL